MTCAACHGRGWVEREHRHRIEGTVTMRTERCDACRGTPAIAERPVLQPVADATPAPVTRNRLQTGPASNPKPAAHRGRKPRLGPCCDCGAPDSRRCYKRPGLFRCASCRKRVADAYRAAVERGEARRAASASAVDTPAQRFVRAAVDQARAEEPPPPKRRPYVRPAWAPSRRRSA